MSSMNFNSSYHTLLTEYSEVFTDTLYINMHKHTFLTQYTRAHSAQTWCGAMRYRPCSYVTASRDWDAQTACISEELRCVGSKLFACALQALDNSRLAVGTDILWIVLKFHSDCHSVGRVRCKVAPAQNTSQFRLLL